jgi:membrane protease YdiL (CAAX protease family)
VTTQAGRWQRLLEWVAPPAPARATQRRSPITTRRAYLQVAAVYVVGFALPVINAFILLAHPEDVLSPHAPTLHGQVLNESLGWAIQLPGVLLAVWLAHRRGWTLRRLGIAPAWAAGSARHRQALRIGCLSFLSIFVAGIVLHLLAPGASFPTGRTGPWGMIGAVSSSIRAGLSEELVVTAFIVTTLRQARRPVREIVLVSLTLRVAYHVYYGSPWVAVWVAIWAGTAFWLYWRTRRLTPLIVAHAVFDLLGLTSVELGRAGTTVVGAIYLMGFFAGFMLLVVATIKEVVRSQAQTSAP